MYVGAMYKRERVPRYTSVMYKRESVIESERDI